MSCITQNNGTQTTDVSMQEYIKMKNQMEDQVDYAFVQRIVQELTQSCALPIPVPASAIPPLIRQAAQHFWDTDDMCVEERYLCLPYKEFMKCGPNNVATLPPRVISVFGVYKTTDTFNYGVMGDFSLERMILNNSALASGAGGTLSDVFGSGTGYNLTDVSAALYEVSTYKSMFDSPLTFNYNYMSNKLAILGALGHSDLILQCYIRCKIQDMYKNYDFFRYCVCLGLRSMAVIMGTFEFKLAGNVTLNYQVFRDMAETEMDKIDERIKMNHSADYFFNTNSI